MMRWLVESTELLAADQGYLVNKPNALKVFVIPQNLLFSASSAEKCEFMGNPVWFLDTRQAFVGFLRIALAADNAR
jgi:hypothetical protein